VLAAQLAHCRGDDHARRVADDDAAGLGRGPGLRRGLGRRTQQRLGPRQEHLTRLGQPGALRCAVEKADAELVFQAANLPTQRRLRNTQRAGRAAEVPVLGHHNEVPDQSQVKVHHLRCRVGHALIVAGR
jgi:hypothetical protein